MKERPILMSAPMVRAILAGTKTVTRRICKVPAGYVMDERDDGSPWPWYSADVVDDPDDAWLPCPYGEPGDRLWIKETWGLHAHHDETDWERGSVRGRTEDEIRQQYRLAYRADWGPLQEGCFWRPSIFMMRWMSRITLDVVSVRVERLQAIDDADAKREGAAHRIAPGGDLAGAFDHLPVGTIGYREHFASLWREINGPASWDANPWVWRVEFRRVEGKR